MKKRVRLTPEERKIVNQTINKIPATMYNTDWYPNLKKPCPRTEYKFLIED